jgi:1,2-dihydroxy-3-keto-5-methylthiopentene dioxygenase
MDDDVSPDKRAQEEAEVRARDERRRREEEERKRKADEDRRAEEKRIQTEKLKRLEEERRRLKQEDDWKRLGSDKIVPLPAVPATFVDDHDPNALRAWHVDDEVSKQQLRRLSLKPGRKAGAPPVTLQQLKELGIAYFRINLNDFGVVNQIVKERCYKHTDEVRVSQTCKDEAFINKWFVEHMNEDEQIRLITDGSCYIDVRSRNDTWIRLHVQAGDLIVLPAGMYHRGTLDEDDYCAFVRLFRDSQSWNPLPRTEKRAENSQSRQQYAKMLKKGNVATELGFK